MSKRPAEAKRPRTEGGNKCVLMLIDVTWRQEEGDQAILILVQPRTAADFELINTALADIEKTQRGYEQKVDAVATIAGYDLGLRDVDDEVFDGQFKEQSGMLIGKTFDDATKRAFLEASYVTAEGYGMSDIINPHLRAISALQIYQYGVGDP